MSMSKITTEAVRQLRQTRVQPGGGTPGCWWRLRTWECAILGDNEITARVDATTAFLLGCQRAATNS